MSLLPGPAPWETQNWRCRILPELLWLQVLQRPGETQPRPKPATQTHTKPVPAPLCLTLSHPSTGGAEQPWRVQSWAQMEQPGRTQPPGTPSTEMQRFGTEHRFVQAALSEEGTSPHSSAPAISCCCCFHELGAQTGSVTPPVCCCAGWAASSYN